MTQPIGIQSVNISGLAPLVPGVKRTRTGIHKQPVSAQVAVQPLGLEGDRVGNTTYHGGPDQAVYLYSADDYAWWSAQRGTPCAPGLFGENLTIDRWWPDPRIGDRLTIGDVILDLGDGFFVDQRALIDTIVHAVADLELRHAGGEFFSELIVYALLNEQAIGADAGLAGIAELGNDRAFDGRIQIGIIKHHEGRVAA